MSTALCICDTFMDTNILMGPPTQLRVKNTKNSIELTDAALDHILSTNKRPDHIILGTCGPQSPELEYIISKYEVIHINHPQHLGPQAGTAKGYAIAISKAIELKADYLVCMHGDIFVDAKDWIQPTADSMEIILFPKTYGNPNNPSNAALETKIFMGPSEILKPLCSWEGEQTLSNSVNRNDDVEHRMFEVLGIQATIKHNDWNPIYHTHQLPWKIYGTLILTYP